MVIGGLAMTALCVRKLLVSASYLVAAAFLSANNVPNQAAVPNDILLEPLTGSKWDFDGRFLLGARGRVAFLWDAHTGDLVQRFEFSDVFRVRRSDNEIYEIPFSEHPNYLSSVRPHPSSIRALAIYPGAADILTGAGSAAPSDRFAHANFIRRGNVEHAT